MSTTGPDPRPTRPRPRRRPRSAGVLAALTPLLAGAVLLAGCSDQPGRAAGPAPSEAADQPTSGVSVDAESAPDLVRALGRILDRRAAAVLDDDLPAYRRTLADQRGFRAVQEAFYDNLQQLPLAELAYDVDASSLRRQGSSYWITVRIALQLDGFDAAPSQSVDRFRFSPSTSGNGYRLSSVTDPEWEAANDVTGQPWELVPIQTREEAGVLVVTDAPLRSRSRAVLGSLERGIADVQARVPYDDWDGTVVVYALSDPRFLDGLPDVPGEDPEALDGVAFTVPTSRTDPTPVATRVLLSPGVVGASRAARDRLVRHELTHVAVGTHDDVAPTWLSEGLAEWVSVQAVAPQDRTVDPAALAYAEDGAVTMPDDASFNGPMATENYALAWFVCEYLAQTYHRDAPWLLLDALDDLGLDPDDDTEKAADEEVERILQMGVGKLARRAATLLVDTFRPSFAAPYLPPSGRSGRSATPPATDREDPAGAAR